jgi:Flp pilus assembly protein TadD
MAMKNLCDALIQARDFRSAPDVCRKVTELRPDDPDAFYNLAGAWSLLGRADEALAALQRDFELGDRNYEYLQNDDWFAPLRADSRFVALVQKMREAAPAP